jgi:hypothetical protein
MRQICTLIIRIDLFERIHETDTGYAVGGIEIHVIQTNSNITRRNVSADSTHGTTYFCISQEAPTQDEAIM